MTKKYDISEEIRNNPQLAERLTKIRPKRFGPENVLIALPQEIPTIPQGRNFSILAPPNIGVTNLLELYRAGAQSVIIPKSK